MLRHLFRPFAYLKIEHKEKWKLDWLYPLFLSLVSLCLIMYAKGYGQVVIFADTGLVSKIQGFVSILPGFYIAALAAIATFNKVDIDKTMPAPAPKIDVLIQGKNILIDLTRRRFLCLMFAFLTAESLLLIIFGIFAQVLYVPGKAFICEIFHPLISNLLLLVYLFLFWQMVVASFWGLFYLGERLHQPDS